ncbi:MAG: amidohydrolase family protein [Granulosicoccus sp.]|nr:amidohydrolase family protein [Granulosicoccus sp.]
MRRTHRRTSGRWLTTDGWRELVCVHAEHIESFEAIEPSAHLPQFIPAPVDLHVHGGGGADVMQGDDALRTVLRTHARHGTGALLATSVTAPFEQIDDFLNSVERVMSDPPADGAVLLGVHLEGPFINPDKLGAQPDFAEPVNKRRLESWLASGLVRVITYAPEMDSTNCVPALCERYAVKAQVGHSLCHWSLAHRAILAGVGVTHLFNAMSGVDHREGGVALAALAYADYAEIITDGIHVEKPAFDLARRSIPHVYSVTDATAASGMPDGIYQLGSLSVEKTGDRVMLADGTLAGSCLTQQASIQLLRAWGLEWQEIVERSCEFPARWINAECVGNFRNGSLANWLELRDDVPVALWLNGNRLSLNKQQ